MCEAGGVGTATWHGWRAASAVTDLDVVEFEPLDQPLLERLKFEPSLATPHLARAGPDGRRFVSRAKGGRGQTRVEAGVGACHVVGVHVVRVHVVDVHVVVVHVASVHVVGVM